jgi:hypothetical protein
MKPDIQDIDGSEMWKDAIGESNWKQKAGMPEFQGLDGLTGSRNWSGRVTVQG